MIPSLPSSFDSLILTVPRPGDMPSDVEPPTLVGFSVKPVISLKSLPTCTSAALSISQQLCFGPLTADNFDRQMFLSGVGSALSAGSCVA